MTSRPSASHWNEPLSAIPQVFQPRSPPHAPPPPVANPPCFPFFRFVDPAAPSNDRSVSRRARCPAHHSGAEQPVMIPFLPYHFPAWFPWWAGWAGLVPGAWSSPTPFPQAGEQLSKTAGKVPLIQSVQPLPGARCGATSPLLRPSPAKARQLLLDTTTRSAVGYGSPGQVRRTRSSTRRQAAWFPHREVLARIGRQWDAFRSSTGCACSVIQRCSMRRALASWLRLVLSMQPTRSAISA